MIVLRLALLLGLGLGLAAGDAPPRAEVSCGAVEGVWEEARGGPGLAAFRGIPYAKQSRFLPPSAAGCEAWGGGEALNASEAGDVCWQAGGVLDGTQTQSEDCLNLNVFTYELAGGVGEGVPVLLWLYGGSLMLGSAEWYGRVQNLAEPGRAVVVAINYRLAAFGFLALSELSEADPRGTSGNLGFLDQQAAMRWVRDNVAAFGGDPSRVTLIGQSSGGTSVLAHLAMPSSAGLFAAGVSLSGSPNMTMSLDRAERLNRELFLPRTPCAGAADVRACLLGMPAPALAAAAPDAWYGGDDFPSNTSGIGWPALAVVDGVTVPAPLLDALAAAAVDVPLILQNVECEDDSSPDPAVLAYTPAALRSFLERNFEAWGAGPGLGDRVAELYAVELGPGAAAPAETYYAVSSDTGVTCGTKALATAAGASFRSPVYVSLVKGGPARPFPVGGGVAAQWPFHMWDYIAAAGTWDLLDADDPYEPEAADLELGAMLREQWYALAAGGSLASAPPHARWDAVFAGNVTAPSYVHGAVFSNHTESRVNLKSRACDFWQAIGVDARFWWSN